MKNIILQFVRGFITGGLDVNIFTESYCCLWEIDRDNNPIYKTEPMLNKFLTDLYEVIKSDFSYEGHTMTNLHEERLFIEIIELFDRFNMDYALDSYKGYIYQS